ncbi:uncharacterized protein LOC132048650 [Lycium ferocissimum]|uniref:uncharacterized protein LOC132048650 n=1 Tax=Lycium ferocissimum TaxID=112874 RepID=UPI002815F6CE|nr:uncharacterized protein LOC132048650 [Lycium ferocissimum]
MHEEEVEVNIDAQAISKRGSFKYLGSKIQGSGEIDENVAHRIGTSWGKWSLASTSRALSSQECPCPQDECGRDEDALMDVWAYRRDMIRNEVTQGKVRVTSIADKMKGARLRWFRHMKRRCEDVPVRRCQSLAIIGVRRGRGRLMKH